jgi:hypothetical protein
MAAARPAVPSFSAAAAAARANCCGCFDEHPISNELYWKVYTAQIHSKI